MIRDEPDVVYKGSLACVSTGVIKRGPRAKLCDVARVDATRGVYVYGFFAGCWAFCLELSAICLRALSASSRVTDPS